MFQCIKRCWKGARFGGEESEWGPSFEKGGVPRFTTPRKKGEKASGQTPASGVVLAEDDALSLRLF